MTRELKQEFTLKISQANKTELAVILYEMLLAYLEEELIPLMEPYHYHVAVDPTALVLGLAGCHSNYLPMFRKVAQEEGVSLHRLIVEVSAIDRKAPSEQLIRQVAGQIKA